MAMTRQGRVTLAEATTLAVRLIKVKPKTTLLIGQQFNPRESEFNSPKWPDRKSRSKYA